MRAYDHMLAARDDYNRQQAAIKRSAENTSTQGDDFADLDLYNKRIGATLNNMGDGAEVAANFTLGYGIYTTVKEIEENADAIADYISNNKGVTLTGVAAATCAISSKCRDAAKAGGVKIIESVGGGTKAVSKEVGVGENIDDGISTSGTLKSNNDALDDSSLGSYQNSILNGKPSYSIGKNDGGPGTWETRSTPKSGADYQMQITGAPVNTEYVIKTDLMKNGEIKFDGYDPARKVLIDAKDYKNWPIEDKDWSINSVLADARKQSAVANQVNASVEWHISSPEKFQLIQQLLRENQIKNIRPMYTPKGN